MKTIKTIIVAIAVLWFIAPPGFINLSALAGIVPDIDANGATTASPMARFFIWAASCLVGIFVLGALSQMACIYLIPLRKRNGEIVEPPSGECHARTVFQVICAIFTILGLVTLAVMMMAKWSGVLGV